MSTKKGNKWDALSKVEGTSPVKEREKATTKAKHIKNMPISFFEDHAKLKNEGKTCLDFSSYILEAVREKLKRDNKVKI